MATFGYDEDTPEVSKFQAEVDRLVQTIEGKGYAVDLSHEPGGTHSVKSQRGGSREVVLPPVWVARASVVPATRTPGPKPQEGRTILEALQRLERTLAVTP